MKKLLKIVAVLFGLIVIAGLALPLFISADTLKAQLIAQVQKTTGRKLEIDGKTSLSMFPNIAVSAEGVTLYNPDGFKSPYLVKMKKLSTGAALGPLFSGNLQVTGITLDDADVYLEQNAQGAKNWEFTSGKVQKAAEEESKEPDAQSGSFIQSFALGDIKVSNSKLHYSKPGAKPMDASDVDITLSGADANAPLKLDGSATYHKENVDVDLVIEHLKDFLADKSSPIKANIVVPGASIDFDGAGHMGQSVNASGKFKADVSSLPATMEWATGEKSAASLPKTALIEGTLAAKDNKYGIDGGNFKVNDTAAKGKLAVDTAGKVPAIIGALAFGELNMDDWKAADESKTGGNSGGKSGAAKAEGWSDQRIDLSALRAFNASLALTFDAIKTDTLKLGPTSMDVNVTDGALKLVVDKTALYNGTANGTVRLSEAGIAANIAAGGVKIEPLMEDLSGKSRVDGIATMKLNLQGSGNSERAIVSTLNGSGDIKIADGAIKGINLAQFWRDAKKGFLFDSPSEKTDFSELSGSFTMANGVATNKDLALKSPVLRVSGQGTANLPARTVNYTLTPTVVATTKGQGGKDDLGGISVPLLIAGSWSNPSITPDLAGMLKDPKALQQNIKNIGSEIKNYNSVGDLKKAILGGGTAAPATTTPATTTTTPQAAPSKDEQLKQGIGNLLKGF